MFIFTHVFVPTIALGDCIASLKAAFDKEIAALNASDQETVMTMQRVKIVAMDPGSHKAIDTKPARREGYQQLLDAAQKLTVTPQNLEFRVVVHSGIVWGTYGILNKPKGGEEVAFPIRPPRSR